MTESSVVMTIDVAHPPRDPDAVEQQVRDAIRHVRNSTSLRVVKIIHGYGSRGRGGGTKTVVANLLFREKRAFRSVIEGENYAVLNGETAQMRSEAGQFADPDLGAANPGITIVWVR